MAYCKFTGTGGGLQNSESFSSFSADPTKLNDQELDCLKEAFSLFDADHDGEITINELGRVMRNHGLNPTDDELRGRLEKKIRNDRGYQKMIKLPHMFLKS